MKMTLTVVALLTLVPVAGTAKLNVVTTTQDLAYFARVIGGEDARVTPILRGYQDPHFASAKPSFMVAASRADIVLSVGLDLEVGWLPLILQGARNPSVMPGEKGFVDCSRFVTPIEVPAAGADRSKGDIHPQGNPHYWLDAGRASAVARGIAGVMKEIAPGSAPTFDAGLKTLLAEIESADTEARKVLAGGGRRPLVTFHVTYSYFFERYGLSAFASIEPKAGIPPSPSHVAMLIARLKGVGTPATILVEPYYDRDTPQEIALQTGARVALVPSSVGGTDDAETYRAMLLSIARAIAGT